MENLRAIELRINNWVITTVARNEYQIRPEHLGDEDEEVIGESEGIPLTEEWLVKFWFEKREKSIYGNKFIIGIADWGYTIENSFEKGKWFFGHEYYDALDENENFKSMHFSYHIEYVHQLQNLYFSLTGEELTIK